MGRPAKELQRKADGMYMVAVRFDGKSYYKSLDTRDEKVAKRRFNFTRQALWNRIRKQTAAENETVLPTQTELDAQQRKKFEMVPDCPGVYFVRWAGDNRAVKIGQSSNIRERCRGYLTHNHEDLFLLAFIPTYNGKADELEKSLHEKFKGLRFKGEWFWLEYPLNEEIRRIGAEQHWEPVALGLNSL
jgi:hypothetical protein